MGTQGTCRQLPAAGGLILRDDNQKYVLLTVVTPEPERLPVASISFSGGTAVGDLQGTEGCHWLSRNWSHGITPHRLPPENRGIPPKVSKLSGSRGTQMASKQ